MFKKTKKYLVETQYDFGKFLNGYTVVDSSIGPNGEICILAVNKVPERINGMFPPVQTTQAYNYKALIFSKEHCVNGHIIPDSLFHINPEENLK